MIQDDWKYNDEKIPDNIILDAIRSFPIDESGHAYCDLEKIQIRIQQAYMIGRMEERKLK